MASQNNHNVKAATDLSPQALINAALSRNEGELAANGALIVNTGKRTGRSPKDRFIVKDSQTANQVDWNTINQPIDGSHFERLWQRALDYLEAQDMYFVSHLQVGASAKFHIPVTILSELAWHNLFACNLFIKPDQAIEGEPWTILSVPNFKPDGANDGVAGDAAIILNFSAKKLLVAGTHYAGEIKKGMFSVLNFILPEFDILPMHCAANAGVDGETTLFFGLSGTGKTTLSADPHRFLIGDDEHGWGTQEIFNFEGGCYAKCIDLSREREPIIYDAIRSGTVLENVVIDPTTKEPDYGDASRTQNTRAAYPREFIPKRVEANKGKTPKNVIFLTCDLFGVLPPVAKLTATQAAYYFLSGYTALVGSTEVGSSAAIQPTFSTCFGAPFFPRSPQVYANLLMKRLEEHEADVYLVNTGWSGGAYGQGGERFSIPVTRRIVSAIVDGKLKNASYSILPGFNLNIPTAIENIDSQLLDPRKNWKNLEAYRQTTQELIAKFINNFARFQVEAKIRDAGPKMP